MLEPNYPQIVDGFVYSGLHGTRPLIPGTSWYWGCLANMENLRVAADSFRPRWWTVPKNFLDSANANNENIAPGKTNFYEFQVKPGSYLYAMQFAVFDDFALQSNWSVIVRQGSDLGLADRPMAASNIYSGSPIDPLNTLKPPVNPLPEPRLIISPGQINVEISNDSAADEVSVQLLLLFAELK